MPGEGGVSPLLNEFDVEFFLWFDNGWKMVQPGILPMQRNGIWLWFVFEFCIVCPLTAPAASARL
jgi:hypothetical protein